MEDTILGHHKIGDYHWYTSFEKSNYFDSFDINNKLIEGKEFKTHEDILGLITFIHESYHFIQDITLGLCTWLQFNIDQYAIGIYQLSKLNPQAENIFPLHKITNLYSNKYINQLHSLEKENHFLNKCIYSSEMTDNVLDAESNAHKGISGNLKVAYGLTGQDLIECHTAIMTERFLSNLIKKYPTAFNEKILKDLEPYFRVEKMNSTQKTLDVFNKYMSFLKYDKANQQHPLYPVCSRAAEYGFYLFLLDYALHCHPVSTPNVDIQDIIPTIRFLKLTGSVLTCLMNLKDRNEFNLNEEYLFIDFMPKLVKFINECNRMGNRGPSFIMYNDITKYWIDEYEKFSKSIYTLGLTSLFDIFHQYHVSALKIIDMNPMYVYTSSINSIIIDLNINPVFSTNTIVHSVSPFIGSLTEEQKDGRTIYKSSLTPYEMVDTFVGRELFIELSKMILNGSSFECPVVSRLNFYPCKEKTDKCHKIERPSHIPKCFAQQVFDDFYSNYSNN